MHHYSDNQKDGQSDNQGNSVSQWKDILMTGLNYYSLFNCLR
jgi:hypothetical protein